MNIVLVFYLIASLVAFIIVCLIAKEVFGMTRILKHSRAQTVLLTLIAEKLGVDQNKARKQYFTAEGKGYTPIETKPVYTPPSRQA